jgi:hypothetical protein
VTAPAQSKIYTVINATTGGFAVQLVGAGPTTGVTIANGARATVAWNGSDFVEVSRFSDLVVYGNVGIGTSSPTQKLQVKGAVAYEATNSTNAWQVYNYTDNTLRFNYNGVGGDELIMDSSGNLGLGVTPSAWGGNFKAIQVGSQAAFSTDSGVTADLVLNAHQSGSNWIYKANGLATLMRQESGVYKFFNAPVGTAGNAITFTQAMTLDASGNLGVGTTSPQAPLHVKGTNASEILRLESTDTTGDCYIRYTDPNGAKGYIGYVESATNNFAIHNTLNTPMLFYTNNTERARIDSSGNLLVGKTSTADNVAGTRITQGGLIVAGRVNADPIATIRFDTNGDIVTFYRGTSNVSATQVGSVSVTTTATAYNTSSDYRLKNITGNLTGYKERLMSLQPKQGTWKVDGSEFRGFLAHEFSNPYSASVTGEKDAVDENGNPMMQSMQASSSEVMADLVALIQEQQVIIESLKARLDAANL